MKDLNEIREELDVLDREIVKLLEERFELSKEVAYFKKESAKKVLDKEREEIKLAAVKALVSHEENKYFIEDLFIHIMDLSRKLQYRIISNYEDTFTNDYEIIEDIQRENIKVVYQGVPGSYSYEAMIKEFGDKVDCFNASTFKDVMLSIQKGQADYAVLPIENSSAGIVSETYDLMVDFDCFITKEINIIEKE